MEWGGGIFSFVPLCLYIPPPLTYHQGTIQSYFIRPIGIEQSFYRATVYRILKVVIITNLGQR